MPTFTDGQWIGDWQSLKWKNIRKKICQFVNGLGKKSITILNRFYFFSSFVRCVCVRVSWDHLYVSICVSFQWLWSFLSLLGILMILVVFVWLAPPLHRVSPFQISYVFLWSWWIDDFSDYDIYPFSTSSS